MRKNASLWAKPRVEASLNDGKRESSWYCFYISLLSSTGKYKTKIVNNEDYKVDHLAFELALTLSLGFGIDIVCGGRGGGVIDSESFKIENMPFKFKRTTQHIRKLFGDEMLAVDHNNTAQ